MVGAANSVACITQVLEARGFDIERCEGTDATRDGILRACDSLIERAGTNDAIVVYYVGHGGLVTNLRYSPNDDLPSRIQHICPTDFGDTTEDDFRGISYFELTLQVVNLTKKTQNVTLILECDFSAQMIRGNDRMGAVQPPEREPAPLPGRI